MNTVIEAENQIKELLNFSINTLTENNAVEFLEKFGTLLIVSNHSEGLSKVTNPIKSYQEKHNQHHVICKEDKIKRTKKQFTIEDVLNKLLDEGIDPDPTKSGNLKKNILNKISSVLGIVYTNGKVWKTTKKGKELGCTNMNASVLYSQIAYEQIKEFILNQ